MNFRSRLACRFDLRAAIIRRAQSRAVQNLSNHIRQDIGLPECDSEGDRRSDRFPTINGW